MRQIKVALAVFILAIGCRHVSVSTQTHPTVETFVETIEQMRRSIVPIVCTEPIELGKTSKIVSIEGSGFFISSDGVFVTAGHVVYPVPERCSKGMAVYIPQKGWQGFTGGHIHFFPFDCLVNQTDVDLALCTPRQDIKTILDIAPVPVRFTEEAQRDGTSIAFTGFPLQYTLPVTSRAHIAAYADIRPEHGAFVVILDSSNWPGMSGGPIYLSDGTVIGMILQGGIQDAAGTAYGRPAPYIEAFISDARQHKQGEQKH